MEYIKVRITFKSGRTIDLESKDYYKGQFRQWIDRNLIKSNGEQYVWVVWNDLFININEIEHIKEL